MFDGPSMALGNKNLTALFWLVNCMLSLVECSFTWKSPILIIGTLSHEISIFLETMVKLFDNSGDPDQIWICNVCQISF